MPRKKNHESDLDLGPLTCWAIMNIYRCTIIGGSRNVWKRGVQPLMATVIHHYLVRKGGFSPKNGKNKTCVCETRMPPAFTKSNYGKNLQVPHFEPAPPQGHVTSMKCEQPLDELTVQVWLLYDHRNFKYCTLLVSGTELRTDRRADDPNARCPRRTFQDNFWVKFCSAKGVESHVTLPLNPPISTICIDLLNLPYAPPPPFRQSKRDKIKTQLKVSLDAPQHLKLNVTWMH